MVLPLPFLSCTVHLGHHYNIMVKISVTQSQSTFLNSITKVKTYKTSSVAIATYLHVAF